MRLILLIVLTFSSGIAYSQRLFFHGEEVDTINVVSSSGYYHFDDAGTTTEQSEYFTVTFSETDKKYIATHKRVFSTLTCKPVSNTQKEKEISKKSFTNSALLDSLLKAVTTKYQKPTLENIGLDEKSFAEKTSKKRILWIAKLYKEDWHFKNKYSDKETNDSLFRDCQNIDSFKYFLSTIKADTGNSYRIVSDYSDETFIYITTKSGHYSLEGKYPNKYKLPWYFRKKTDDWGWPTSMFNFDINKWLGAILPKKFYRINTIKVDAVVNDYIKWYLIRKGIVTSYYN